MARTLDDQLDYRNTVNFSPGFAVPGPARGPSPLPPPQGSNWSPWAPAEPAYNPPQHRQSTYSSPQPDFAFTSPPLPQPPKRQNSNPAVAPARATTPPQHALTAPIPSIATLHASLPTIQNPNHDPALRLAWARDVLFLVDKQQENATSTDTPQGPAIITDSQLLRLSQIAVPLVLQIAAAPQGGITVAEAIYYRATFAASGAYPEHVPMNPKVAFRDFEAAARGGYPSAWFKLGRDYENFKNDSHAKECFERGVKMGSESCLYVSSICSMFDCFFFSLPRYSQSLILIIDPFTLCFLYHYPSSSLSSLTLSLSSFRLLSFQFSFVYVCERSRFPIMYPHVSTFAPSP